MKNILGRVFAIWAMLVFIITMFIFFIPILVTGLWPEPARTKTFQVIANIWMRIFFFLTGLRISVKGREKFSKDQNYVVACNHNSFMDVPLTTPFIPGANKTIAKKEMASIPLFGIIYRRGSVLVDRKNEESRKASYSEMKLVLEKGMHMCVYPEGTRNKTKQPLQPFHSGAFRLAIDTSKPVMPAVIFNTAKVLPAGKSFFFWPVKIKMHFLDPIPADGLTMEQLKQKVHDEMYRYYITHRDQ